MIRLADPSETPLVSGTASFPLLYSSLWMTTGGEWGEWIRWIVCINKKVLGWIEQSSSIWQCHPSIQYRMTSIEIRSRFFVNLTPPNNTQNPNSFSGESRNHPPNSRPQSYHLNSNNIILSTYCFGWTILLLFLFEVFVMLLFLDIVTFGCDLCESCWCFQRMGIRGNWMTKSRSGVNPNIEVLIEVLIFRRPCSSVLQSVCRSLESTVRVCKSEKSVKFRKRTSSVCKAIVVTETQSRPRARGFSLRSSRLQKHQIHHERTSSSQK